MSTPFLRASQGPGARPAGWSLPGARSEWEEQTAAELQDHVLGIRWELQRAAAGSEEGPVSLGQGITSEVTPGLALAFHLFPRQVEREERWQVFGAGPFAVGAGFPEALRPVTGFGLY